MKRVSTCADALQRGSPRNWLSSFGGGRFLSGGRGTCLGAVYVKYTVSPAITDDEQDGVSAVKQGGTADNLRSLLGIEGIFLRDQQKSNGIVIRLPCLHEESDENSVAASNASVGTRSGPKAADRAKGTKLSEAPAMPARAGGRLRAKLRKEQERKWQTRNW